MYASEIDRQQFVVIPLSVQRDGDDYLVGNAERGDFYQMPEIGVRILNLLQRGESPASVKAAFADECPDLDVADFIEQLGVMGFIYPQDAAPAYLEQRNERPGKRVLRIAPDPRLARAVFSVPGAIAYFAILAYASLLLFENPALRISRDALYISSNVTLTLLALLVLYCVVSLIHEAGHLLAAARHGVKSTLGIGNRLWMLVMEADITGVLALPKRQRYLPLCGGLLADLFSISLCTIALNQVLRHGGSPFLAQLIRALILQIVITMTWQFNIFLRTDIYYVLCTLFSHPDLDTAARAYLHRLVYRATAGRFGQPGTDVAYRSIGILRAFTAVWVLGRLAALWLLLFVLAPTLMRYVSLAIAAFRDPRAAPGTAVDMALMIAVTLVIFGAGIYMWVAKRQWKTAI